MSSKIIWMDLEMTGLDPKVDEIIEIACIITDSDLTVLEEAPVLTIKQEAHVFERMDAWNQNQHTKSGLWANVLKSTMNITEAEKIVLQFLKEQVPPNSYLAGNSIWQDRRFLRKYMPKVDAYMHYRMIDVTSIKLVSNYWHPKVKYSKKEAHRALDDVKESIEELNYYKQHIFDFESKTKE